MSVTEQSLPAVAVFDFDGTITRQDTFRDFFVSSFGPIRCYAYMAAISPLLAFYLMGLVGNDTPKRLLFGHFFRGCTLADYRQRCRSYASQRLPELIRPAALERISWHRERGHRLVIASASMADWIEPWAHGQGFDHVIATGIEHSGEKLTGRFAGRCPYGMEKVTRLQALGVSPENAYIYAYGDSAGDRELLRFAQCAEFRPFH